MKLGKLVAISVLVTVGFVGCKKKKEAGAGETPAPSVSASPAGSPEATPAPTAAASPAPSAPANTAYCGANPCPCKAGSEQKTGDKLTMCELETAVTIGAVKCQPGRLLFHDNGMLEECLTTAETKVGEYTCKGSPLTVAWHKSGSLRACSLAVGALIAGVTVAEGQGIQLYPDGKLRSAYANGVVFQGWTCSGYTYLFPDGKLESCTVGAAGKVGDQEVPAGSDLRLTADGQMRGIRLGDKGKVAGKAAKKGESFCWDDGVPSAGQGCWMF